MPAISQAAHSKSDMKYKSSGTYQPIMSNPAISVLISKRHVIWWVRPILRYSRPLPSDRSTCFLRLSWLSSLPIFFVLVSEGLATPGRPCGQASQLEPWHTNSPAMFQAMMDHLLQPWADKWALEDMKGSWYMEDVLIVSTDKKKHQEATYELLDILVTLL